MSAGGATSPSWATAIFAGVAMGLAGSADAGESVSDDGSYIEYA